MAKLIGGLKKIAESVTKAKPIKASEALGAHEGKVLNITQADRTKLGGKYLGGPGFSSLQLTDPAYAKVGAVWGVNGQTPATMILNANKRYPDNAIWSTMLGSPTQHRSNQHVYDSLIDAFMKSAKGGNIDPNLHMAINKRLMSTVDNKGNTLFDPSVDILSRGFRNLGDTFDRRAAIADVLAGEGIGGKKGQIFDYDKVIRKATDPDLVDVPTGSIGNRLFTLDGGQTHAPELHSAFPNILTGEDMGVTFGPAPREIVMKDYIDQYTLANGRAPGVMAMTRGYAPSNMITEGMLTRLQKAGYKRGGLVC